MRFLIFRHLLTGLLFAGLTQCRAPQESDTEKSDPPTLLHQFTYQQALMGTKFYVTFYAEDKGQADTAAAAAFQYGADVNSACSDYDVTSELMKLNASPANQPLTLSPMLFEVLSTGLKIADETKGAYDPTLGWHSYNWRMARKKGLLPSSEKIATAKASSGWKNLKLEPHPRSATKLVSNMRLDLGGIAKGYAADGMLEVLKDHSITRASITAGGEVRLGDPPPNKNGWEITLKTLDTHHELSPKTLTLSQCGVSTSGDLHQSITIDGRRYSHVVNPSTGLGLTSRVSATVIAKNATRSDALATALSVNPKLQPSVIEYFVIFTTPEGELNIRSSKSNFPR